jgi:hypothetical protein
MERTFVIENARERERLKKLVQSLTDEELRLVIYQEGWTIAVILVHLAFGDQRTLTFLKKWRKDGVTRELPGDINNINDALLNLFLAIPPRKAADLAISSAETIDRELEAADAVLTDAIAKHAPNRLNRSIHRKMHVDEIEAFLETKRNKK